MEQNDSVVLKEILKWIKFQSVLKAKEVLQSTLTRDIEKLIYEYSDGRGSQEIANLVNVSHGTVFNYWKKWFTLGIVEPISVKGGIRYKKVFSLRDFGIEVPLMKEEKTISEPQETVERSTMEEVTNA